MRRSLQLAADARELLGADPTVEVTTVTALDCRYQGQSHELRVPGVAEFPAAHRTRNGYVPDGVPIEVVALRAVAEAPAPATIEQVLERRAAQVVAPVAGPQVVVREDCTIWVPDGWTGRPGPLGSLVLSRSEAGS